MPTTASELFDFLESPHPYLIDRREVYSTQFVKLRRSLRSIVGNLLEIEDGDSRDIAELLRATVSEWLTVPVPFDDSLIEFQSILGDPEDVRTRWGSEIYMAYDRAREAAGSIQGQDSPLRDYLRQSIEEHRLNKRSMRIYCHRGARLHFESLFSDGVPSEIFLHSVRDYRESDLVDVLLKVGPLRSRGWGAAPDSLLTAPRFTTLLQLVWSGCNDEDDFGYDPAVRSEGRSVLWSRRQTALGDPQGDPDPDGELDELRYFQEISRAGGRRRAVLVQIDDENGILFPPHAAVLTFDIKASDEEAIADRIAGESLAEDLFLVLPLVGDADLGKLQASDGEYSRIWKARLREEANRGLGDILDRLRANGLDLLALGHCVRQWCKPPSTVIHAPQQMRHFEILIRTLNIELEAPSNSGPQRQPWWKRAWAEIARTRGEAIQTGLQAHEIVGEELLEILQDLLPQIRDLASTSRVFDLEIPDGRSLCGSLRFCQVRSVEDGFLVPDVLLKTVCRLEYVEQWRA